MPRQINHSMEQSPGETRAGKCPEDRSARSRLTRDPGGHFYLVHDVHGERVSPVAIVDRDEGQTLPGRQQKVP